MSLKMKKILAISAVVVIGVVIAAVVIFTRKNDDDSAVEQLALAKQYYEMMDYDKSAAIYNQLLKSNSTEPDIYMGLYDVYMVMGKEEKAIEILERGVDNTSNKAIEEKLAQIYSERGDVTSESEAETEISEDVTEVSVSEQIIETILPVVTESQSEVTESETEELVSDSETETSVTTTTTRPETTTTRVTTTSRPVTTTRVTTTTRRPVTTTRVTTTTTRPVTTTKLTTTKAPEPVGEYEIRQHSISDYVLTRDQIKELGIKSNTIIKVKASNAILYFNSSVFDEVYSIDLSVSFNHTTTKTTVKFKANKLPCDVKVVVTSSNMNSRTLKLAHLFYNDKDNGTIKLDGDGNPVFTAKGGTYTIERVEEVTEAQVTEKNPGYVVIDVGNISSYKLTSDDVKGVGSNKVIQLKSNNVEMYLNSSVFEKQDEVDIGVVITNTSSKSELEFKNSSSFGCEVKIVLVTCDMHPRTLAKAHVYRNGVDLGAVKLTADGDPYFTASSGGKYVIRVPEE